MWTTAWEGLSYTLQAHICASIDALGSISKRSEEGEGILDIKDGDKSYPSSLANTLMFLLLPTSLPTMWHCKGLEEERCSTRHAQ